MLTLKKVECRYNKNKLAVDKEHHDHQHNIFNYHDLTQAKIETAETDKNLYNVCDNLLNRIWFNFLRLH